MKRYKLISYGGAYCKANNIISNISNIKTFEINDNGIYITYNDGNTYQYTHTEYEKTESYGTINLYISTPPRLDSIMVKSFNYDTTLDDKKHEYNNVILVNNNEVLKNIFVEAKSFHIDDYYIIMEPYDDLFIIDTIAINPTLLLNYFLQICNIMQTLFRNNLVYTDLKADNIVICTNTNQLKLIDFGGLYRLNESPYNGQYQATYQFYNTKIISTEQEHFGFFILFMMECLECTMEFFQDNDIPDIRSEQHNQLVIGLEKFCDTFGIKYSDPIYKDIKHIFLNDMNYQNCIDILNRLISLLPEYIARKSDEEMNKRRRKKEKEERERERKELEEKLRKERKEEEEKYQKYREELRINNPDAFRILLKQEQREYDALFAVE